MYATSDVSQSSRWWRWKLLLSITQAGCMACKSARQYSPNLTINITFELNPGRDGTHAARKSSPISTLAAANFDSRDPQLATTILSRRHTHTYMTTSTRRVRGYAVPAALTHAARTRQRQIHAGALRSHPLARRRNNDLCACDGGGYPELDRASKAVL